MNNSVLTGVSPYFVIPDTWMCEQRAGLSRHNDLAKAMDYILKRWGAFTRFLDDRRVCLSKMSPKERCAESLLAESRGSSRVPIAAASGRR